MMKKLFFLLTLLMAAGFFACEDPNKSGLERTYTISFDANGGTGGPAPVAVKIGDALPTFDLANKPKKGTNFFTGYYNARTGGTRYYDSALVPAVEMWSQQPPPKVVA
jgi:hypothetical protein